MIRTALRPRWVVLFAAVLLAAAGMAWLGQWQLSRAYERGSQAQKRALARPPLRLESVLTARRTFPDSAIDRPVRASGTYDSTHQLLVDNRPAIDSGGGSTASSTGSGAAARGGRVLWVLTPLRLADGSAVAVVRGWVPSAEDPAALSAAVPAGRVEVTGVLRPAESPIDRAPGTSSGLPASQLDRVDITQLVQRWPYPLLTGYVVLTDQRASQPVASGSASAVASGKELPRLLPVVVDSGGPALQNLSYAVQWFLFAGFGLVMWWRLVRDDHLGRLRPA